MNFRITTNMMMNSYMYNLMGTTNGLNSAMEKVQSGRQFNSYAEDPTSATLAFGLRRDLWRNENQITNTEFTMSKIQVAWTAAGTLVDGYGLDAKEAILSAITGTSGAGRSTLGIMLQETADSMLNSMNAQYGEHFVFAGDDCMDPPFSWGENGEVLYRGVNVDAPIGSEDWYKLQEMSGDFETNYVDVGIGLSESGGANGTLVTSTAFNNAICGIDLTGWGLDEDGDPLNIISLVKQLGDIFADCDPDNGDFAYADGYADAERLMDKYQASLNYSIEQYVKLDTKQNFLISNLSLLEDARYSMNEQITALEDVDAAEAIMEMTYQQYCYSAALQIGTQVLNQSLLDYMR